MPKPKTCMHCNGAGWVWNPKTQRNDIKCPACNGKGWVLNP